MKTLEHLRQFHNTALVTDLNALESRRKAIAQKLTCVGAAIAGVALIAIFFIVRSGIPFLPGILFPVVIGGVLFAFIAHLSSKGYVREFKNTIIQKIVKFVDENLNYVPHRYVPRSIFVASQIFKTRPNRYKGDDYVSGKVGATQIEFSELHAEYESGSGKNRSRRTVFKGLFFIADFNKHFTCQTIVLPDTAENL
ncbi:MAG: hypothetical protein ACYS76_15820, partial [Planctomycetota bacterium]